MQQLISLGDILWNYFFFLKVLNMFHFLKYFRWMPVHVALPILSLSTGIPLSTSSESLDPHLAFNLSKIYEPSFYVT